MQCCLRCSAGVGVPILKEPEPVQNMNGPTSLPAQECQQAPVPDDLPLPAGQAESLRMPCTYITRRGQQSSSANSHTACRTSWEPEDAPTSPYALDTDLPLQTAARVHVGDILYFLLDIRGVDVVRLSRDCDHVWQTQSIIHILCLCQAGACHQSRCMLCPAVTLHPIDSQAWALHPRPPHVAQAFNSCKTPRLSLSHPSLCSTT